MSDEPEVKQRKLTPREADQKRLDDLEALIDSAIGPPPSPQTDDAAA